MPISNDYALLDPATIIVPSYRQRSKIETEELETSIKARGVLSPIIVRRNSEGSQSPILVAGGRRLQACLNLKIQVPVRYLDSLDPDEAEVIELEENIQREDLPWRDTVKAYGRLCERYRTMGLTTNLAFAERLKINPKWLGVILNVYQNLNSSKLNEATGINHAYNILSKLADRVAAELVSEMQEAGERIFNPEPDVAVASPSEPPTAAFALDEGEDSPIAKSSPPATYPAIPAKPAASPPLPILQADFLTWAPSYSGSKFNFIHCDFPYGTFIGGNFGVNSNATNDDLYENSVELYWKLMDCFVEHFDKFASYSAHVMFWFSMNYYEETRRRLELAGLEVFRRPMIWHKTDGRGIAPTGYLRNIYETAFLAVRGGRPIIKATDNVCGVPSVSNPVHQSQKSESMLRHFFSALVDETTTVLDPTAGSGAAIRIAEELRAKSVLGLELDPEYVKVANGLTIRARMLRLANGG